VVLGSCAQYSVSSVLDRQIWCNVGISRLEFFEQDVDCIAGPATVAAVSNPFINDKGTTCSCLN
jgi:hypothetical protein